MAEAVTEAPPRLTRRQAAIIGAYTGYTCGPFEDIHELAEEVLGRPTWTHEFASERLAEELREKVKPLLMEICAERD